MFELHRPRLRLIAASLVVLALAMASAAGCGSEERNVTISEPAQGATINAGDVKVVVDVKKFNIVDKLDQNAEDGEGHVHFYIDAGEIPTKDGKPAVTKEGTYHAQATTEYVWPDVKAGEHTFAVQLVNNDHTPLKPPVIAQVTVEVKAAGGGTAPASSPTRSPAASPGGTSSPTGGTSSPTGGTATPTPAQPGGTSPAGTGASATATPTRPTATATP